MQLPMCILPNPIDKGGGARVVAHIGYTLSNIHHTSDTASVITGWAVTTKVDHARSTTTCAYRR